MTADKHLDFRRANDPEMAVSVLQRLARHPDPVVRGAVAFNVTTPFITWTALQNDPDSHVRECAYRRKIGAVPGPVRTD